MNILLITCDQLRQDYVGWARDSRIATPNIDRIALQGCAFEDAITTTPLCVPARCSLMTGLYAHQHGSTGNSGDLRRDLPTFASALKAAGYRTEIVGKGHWSFHLADSGDEPTRENYLRKKQAAQEAYGWDYWYETTGKEMPRHHYFDWCHDLEDAGIGYDEYRSYINDASAGGYDQKLPLAERFAEGQWPYEPDLYVDNCIGRRATERLARLTTSEQPFLLWASFCGPHPPYDPPAEYLAQEELDDGIEPIPPVDGELSSDDKRHLAELRRRYRAMIRLIDDQVGQLLDTLEASGQDDTLVIFTADHGEMLGDHGKLNKNLFYRSSVSIPMAIRGPGITPGNRYDRPVELTDVTGTILDAAGLNPLKALSPVSPARSLLPAARDPGNTTVRTHAYSTLAPGWHMIKNASHKYVSGPSGAHGEPWQWLVCNRNDPDEQKDQSDNDAFNHLAMPLRDMLLQTLQRHPAPIGKWIPA